MANFNIAYLIELKDRYTKVAQKIAQVNQRMRESFATLENKLGSLNTRLDDTKAKFRKLSDVGKDAFVGYSVPIGLAIGGIIKMGAELEDTRMVFTTMLGDAQKADKMVSDVMKMASKTPFETPELLNATKLMLNFGVAEKDVMKNLQMLGDISGGNKNRFQSLALAFSQVQSQGRLMGQDLLQMIGQGFNPLQVISEKTGKSMGELKDLMSKGAITAEMVTRAMEIATSKGGRYYELMAKQATTFNGLMSTLSDNFGLAGAKLGEKLMPYIKPFVITLIKMTENLEKVNPKILMVIMGFLGLTAVIPALMVLIGFLGNSYISFIQTMNMVNQGIIKMLALFSKWNIATKIATAVQAVFNATLWMNPITWIVAGIIALVAIIILAYQKVEWFRNLIDTVWLALQTLWSYIKLVSMILWQKLQPALQAVCGFFKNLWNGIVSLLKPVLQFGKFFFMWCTPLGLVIKLVSLLIDKFSFVTQAIEKAKMAMQGFKADADAKVEAKQRELKASEANGSSKTDVNINMKAEQGTQVTKTKVASKGKNKPNVGVNQAGKGR